MSTVSNIECSCISVDAKDRSSEFVSEYPNTPLNPLIQSLNDVSVFDLYNIISLLMFMIPYLSGNPTVLSTKIVVSKKSTSKTIVVVFDKLVKL